jgi:Domain of Unknown Function (DUF748)
MGRYRRHIIALAVVVVLIGAYAAVGFLAVPYFASKEAVEFVRAHYGRTLSLGEIHFNPFTLTLDVTRAALPDADGQTMLAFGRLHVVLQWRSIWRLGPSFREILLDQPFVRAVLRGNHALNLADLGKGFPPAPPKPAEKSAPMRLFIQRLTIASGTGVFEDRTRPTPFRAEFKPISFELRDFSTRAGSADSYALNAASPEGERLTWSGTLQLAPFGSRGMFEIADLKARTLWNYVRDSVPFEISAGVIGIRGDYELRSAGALGLNVNVSTAAVTGLGLKPKGGAQDYIDVARIAVDGTSVDLTRHAMNVAKVTLAGGDIKAWLDEQGQLNLLELAASPATAPPATAPPAATPNAAPPAAAASTASPAGAAPASTADAIPAADPSAAAAPASPATPSANDTAAKQNAAPPAPAATVPAAPAPASAGSRGTPPSGWTVAVPDIAVEGFKVSAEDREVKPAAVLLLSPLNIHVAGFNTSPDDVLDVRVDARLNESGKIDARAKVTPQSKAVSAHVEVATLGLTALQPYLTHYTSMTLLKGALSSKLDFEQHTDGTFAVKGDALVRDLRTVDNALKLDFIKWTELRVADIRYRSKPKELRVGSVTALEPYVRMIIEPDRTLNISEVLKPSAAKAKKGTAPAEPTAMTSPAETAAATSGGDTPSAATSHGQSPATEAPAAAPAAGEQSATAHDKSRKRSRSSRTRATSHQTAAAPGGPPTSFPMSIGAVRVVNGSAHYADLWIKPSFTVGIQSLGGSVGGLSSEPQTRAKVDLNGKIDRYAPVHIGGEINLLSVALYTDVTMSFKDVDLTIVNPYSTHFVGYKIDKGKLSVDVTYKIDQRKLDAKQHFVVDQLELGDRVESPDAVHLPLKIAVALLKDRNGVIDLDLPMSGSLDDPKFRIGPIVWKMFVNLITKVATAPFALLGHLFGGGEHVNLIEFDAGSAQLSQPAKDQLTSVAKALKERPQLKLDVPIAYSAAVDRPQMAANRLRTELLAREAGTREGKRHPDTAGEMALSDPEKHFKLLLEQYQAQLGKDAALPPTAVAVQQAKRKETPPYEAAIADLNAALIDHTQVPDSDLEELGKQRAHAIQNALLSDGQIAPARVFLVNAAPKEASGDKVKVELAVK